MASVDYGINKLHFDWKDSAFAHQQPSATNLAPLANSVLAHPHSAGPHTPEKPDAPPSAAIGAPASAASGLEVHAWSYPAVAGYPAYPSLNTPGSSTAASLTSPSASTTPSSTPTKETPQPLAPKVAAPAVLVEPTTTIKSNGRPPMSYATLIVNAIESSPSKRMTVSEIYEYFLTHYPYFHNAQPTWKNSIRHNLTMKSIFIRADKSATEPGKGGYWTIDYTAKDSPRTFPAAGPIRRPRRSSSAPTPNLVSPHAPARPRNYTPNAGGTPGPFSNTPYSSGYYYHPYALEPSLADYYGYLSSAPYLAGGYYSVSNPPSSTAPSPGWTAGNSAGDAAEPYPSVLSSASGPLYSQQLLQNAREGVSGQIERCYIG
ncbi:uncharacterized protein VTP21DRAFT_3605 [Calcarisporiella thermophila]|uniref:uncharacterized protein n=1 Tax=Calcarisporiella thermophila TaxID=911321 RepID=UPI003743DFB4